MWSFQARFQVLGEASLVGWTPSFAAMISGDGRVEFSLLYLSPRTGLLLLVLLVASKIVLVLCCFDRDDVHSAKVVPPKQEMTRNTTSADDGNRNNRTLRNSFILNQCLLGLDSFIDPLRTAIVVQRYYTAPVVLFFRSTDDPFILKMKYPT